MYYLSLLLISPLWGYLSPRLFFNGWISFLGIIAAIFGLFRRKLSFSDFAATVFTLITRSLFYFILLAAGFYFLYFLHPLGQTNSEVLVFAIAATIQMAILAPTVSGRIDAILIPCGISDKKKP